MGRSQRVPRSEAVAEAGGRWRGEGLGDREGEQSGWLRNGPMNDVRARRNDQCAARCVFCPRERTLPGEVTRHKYHGIRTRGTFLGLGQRSSSNELSTPHPNVRPPPRAQLDSESAVTVILSHVSGVADHIARRFMSNVDVLTHLPWSAAIEHPPMSARQVGRAPTVPRSSP